ncbi:MAG: GCN5-related N-acetyltransferase [Frankiales bacterium]|nr:GCN5-related N-acetyltransferase [Frankiales bacterium]
MPAPGWPASLVCGRVGLRPLRLRDNASWVDLRLRNQRWLQPWEGRQPGLPQASWEERHTTSGFTAMLRALRRESRLGLSLPFAVTYDGQLVGQLTVAGIHRGAAQSATIGYWIDESHAGRGITPTAVAMAVDHCFARVGLHRVEISIRPDNRASLRVVEKVGFRDEGVHQRLLYIDGSWCDHRCFALTVEDQPDGLLRGLLTTVSDSP